MTPVRKDDDARHSLLPVAYSRVAKSAARGVSVAAEKVEKTHVHTRAPLPTHMYVRAAHQCTVRVGRGTTPDTTALLRPRSLHSCGGGGGPDPEEVLSSSRGRGACAQNRSSPAGRSSSWTGRRAGGRHERARGRFPCAVSTVSRPHTRPYVRGVTQCCSRPLPRGTPVHARAIDDYDCGGRRHHAAAATDRASG